jgi:acyl carrier protein
MSDIENRVIALVAKHLKADPKDVKPDAKFSDDLGADSLDQVEMVMAFEEEFGIEIAEEDAVKIVKVSDAINYIQNEIKKAA